MQAPGGPWGQLTCRQGPGGGQCWHVLEQGDAQRPRGEGTGASAAEAGLVPSLRMSSDQAKAHLSHVGCDLAPREAPPSSAPHPRRRPPPTASGAGLRTPVSGRSLAAPQPGPRKGPGSGRLGTEGQAVGPEGWPSLCVLPPDRSLSAPGVATPPGRWPGHRRLAALLGHGLPLPSRTKQKPQLNLARNPVPAPATLPVGTHPPVLPPCLERAVPAPTPGPRPLTPDASRALDAASPAVPRHSPHESLAQLKAGSPPGRKRAEQTRIGKHMGG